MTNKFCDFPSNIDEILRNLAGEYKIKIKKETHYDAINRELQWYKKNKLYRLDFDFSGCPSFITVHVLITSFTFPFLLFPIFSKTKWDRFADIPLGLSKDEYKEIIIKYINQANEEGKA